MNSREGSVGRTVAGRVCALIALSLCCFTAVAQEDSLPLPRKTAAEMPKMVYSADGFVEVVAADIPGDPVGFRLPLLHFATREIRELERAYKLELPKRRAPGLVVYALDGRTNDTRVVVREQRRDGDFVTRVWLPAPGFSDIDDLRFAIARAYFRAWIDRARPAAETVADELPDWVAQGLLRASDNALAHDDIRFVLELWSSARLPYFPALCTDLRRAKGKAAALSGYLAAWMREKRVVKGLMSELAAGSAWSGGRLAELLTDEKDPARQDAVSDERLARLTRAVLSPGRASPWDVKVFTSRLLLYPSEFDTNRAANRSSCTFREALGLAASDEAVRKAAWQKAREMPLCAIGRGDGLVAAAEAFRVFLLGVARGDDAAALQPLLEAAESALEKVRNENGKDDNR